VKVGLFVGIGVSVEVGEGILVGETHVVVAVHSAGKAAVPGGLVAVTSPLGCAEHPVSITKKMQYASVECLKCLKRPHVPGRIALALSRRRSRSAAARC